MSENAFSFEMQKVDSTSSKPIMKCIINMTCIDLEFDTGSSLTVISQDTLGKAGLQVELHPSTKTLIVANGMSKPVKGYAVVSVELNNQQVNDLHLYVVDGFFSITIWAFMDRAIFWPKLAG